MQLRDYQVEALELVRAKLDAGVWSQLLVLPTGAGKTVIFSQLPKVVGGRMLVIAHREELLDQAAEKIRMANPALRVGVDQATRKASADDDVVVASIQTLSRSEQRQAALGWFSAVVVDEAHHVPAGSYQRVLQRLRLAPDPQDVFPDIEDARALRGAYRAWRDMHPGETLLLGVTATPNRADNYGLEWTFAEIVFERTMRWMIERGYLCPLRGYLVQTDTSLDAVKIQMGDFKVNELSEAVNTTERNLHAVKSWLERANGRRTLAFTVDVQHAFDLAEAFQSAGVRAEPVSGDMPPDQRRDIVERYRRGAIEVLCNCQLFTEGFDAPETSCILHARPTKSQSLYIQMTGRGTRPAPGKADCVVLDLVDVSRRHTLATLGDLFGLPKGFNLRGRSVLPTVEAVEKIQQQNPLAVLPENVGLEEIQQRITEINLWSAPESSTVKEMATMGWVERTPEWFVLSIPVRGENGALVTGQEWMSIKQLPLGQWSVVMRSPGQVMPVLETADLMQAFRCAELWVRENRPAVAGLKDANAWWRKRPASEKQKALLRKLGATVKIDTLTRGEAASLLDRYFASRDRLTRAAPR